MSNQACPSVDVPTQWNLTYLMLKSLIPYKKAFEILSNQDANFLVYPSKDNWKEIKVMKSFLSIFKTGIQYNLIHFPSHWQYELIWFFDHPKTLKLGTTQHPLAHLIYKQMKKIEKKLKNTLKTGLAYLFLIIEPMKGKYNKYWSKMEDFADLNQVFDPCFKLELIKFTLMDELTPLVSAATLEQIKLNVIQCFDELNSCQTDQANQNSQSNQQKDSVSTNQILLGENDPTKTICNSRSI